jgi:hypothetical protein
MGLRITTKRSGLVTVVRIDGQLRKEGVAELERVCRSIDGPLCLDLANLYSVDGDAVRAVRMLEDSGAAVAGVSPYIQKLLNRAAQ